MNETITIYFIGTHISGYAYEQALRSMAHNSNFELYHCSQAEPLTITLDRIRANRGRSVILSINDSALHRFHKGKSFREVALQEQIPHICFIIDHPIHVIERSMIDGHTRFLFTSPENETYFHRYCLKEEVVQSDYIWNVGYHYGTRTSEWSEKSFSARSHDLFVPVNFDWQKASFDSIDDELTRFNENEQQIIKQALERYTAVGDTTISQIAEYVENPPKGEGLQAGSRWKALLSLDKIISLQRRRMLLTVLTRFPVSLAGTGIPESFLTHSPARMVPYYSLIDSNKSYPNYRAILNASSSGTHIHERVNNTMAAGSVAITPTNSAMTTIFPENSYLAYEQTLESMQESLEFFFSNPSQMKDIAYNGWKAVQDQCIDRQLFGGLERLVKRALV